MGNKLSRNEVKKLNHREKVTQKVGSRIAKQCGTSNIERTYTGYQNTTTLKDDIDQSGDTIWIRQNLTQHEEPVNGDVFCMESVLEGTFSDEVFDVQACLVESVKVLDGHMAKPQITVLNHPPHSFVQDDHYDVIDDDRIYSLENKQTRINTKDLFSCGFPGSSLQCSHDTTEVQITEEESRCMEYEEMVDIFQPLIIRYLIVREILPYLPFIEDHEDLYAAEKRSKSEAVISLLNELKTWKDVEKWHTFMDALHMCGYEYILKNIQGYNFINHRYQEQYIKNLAPKLSKVLDPTILLPRLLQEEVISEIDRQEIEVEARNNGTIASAILLLNKLPKKHSQWYTKFIKVLRKEGFDEIADSLDILHLTDVIKTKHTSNNSIPKHSIPLQSVPSKTKLSSRFKSQTNDNKNSPVRRKPQLHRPPPPPPPFSSQLEVNTLKRSSKINTAVELAEPKHENRNELKTSNKETHAFPALSACYAEDDLYDDCVPAERYRDETLAEVQEIPLSNGDESDHSTDMYETYEELPAHIFNRKSCSNEQSSETMYGDNTNNDCAPPLPPRGIPPSSNNHFKSVFARNSRVAIPSQDITVYQTLEDDLPFNGNLPSRPPKESKFHSVRVELSDLEKEEADLDEEIKHLERKNDLHSDVNVKLRKRRDLLLDINRKEKEAEALKGPLDEPGVEQPYDYGYLDSANALLMKDVNRHNSLQRKRTMTFHHVSDMMFGESTVKIYDPTTFIGNLKSKLSDCDSAIYCEY